MDPLPIVHSRIRKHIPGVLCVLKSRVYVTPSKGCGKHRSDFRVWITYDKFGCHVLPSLSKAGESTHISVSWTWCP